MKETVIISPQMMDNAKTDRGGYNARQLAVFGIDWPPKKGWRKKLIGQKVPMSKFEEFVYFADF